MRRKSRIIQKGIYAAALAGDGNVRPLVGHWKVNVVGNQPEKKETKDAPSNSGTTMDGWRYT
jgi:hypothetical protein